MRIRKSLRHKIFINIHYLEIGGAETSLIGFLHSMNPTEFNVDILLNDPRGELLQYIPEWVNIVKVPEIYSMIERPIVEVIRRGYIKLAVARLLAKYNYRRYVRKKRPRTGDAIFGYVGKYVTPFLPKLINMPYYDVAISYLTPHNIVADKIDAKKKIAWIHTDYSKIDVDAELELPVWDSFDNIMSISPDVTKSFLKIFPSLKDKIVEIENFIPVQLIKERSEEFKANEMKRVEDEVVLLTIGRYCEAKRIDEIPAIARVLKDGGVPFRWFVIGYGKEDSKQQIIDNIEKEGVSKEVVLIGKKVNPYPYIKACDVYVQPSRYEGKSITVIEAQLLGKPVIITNYPTACSQLTDRYDGLIGPYDTIEFAKFLKKILLEKDVLQKIKENLNDYSLNHRGSLEKFNFLINPI